MYAIKKWPNLTIFNLNIKNKKINEKISVKCWNLKKTPKNKNNNNQKLKSNSNLSKLRISNNLMIKI